MRNIERVAQKKVGNKWETTHIMTDQFEIYRALSNDLIAKKLNGCSYIRSIKRTPNYDGTQTIVVLYNNGVKATYTVTDH